MFRRTISILVIVGLIASQWAAVPHVHAGLSAGELREHNATPHVHVGGGHHGHFHGHHHGGHQHSHAAPRVAKKQPTSNESRPNCGAQYDDNAVYFAAQGQSPAVPAGKQVSSPRQIAIDVCLPPLSAAVVNRHLTDAAVWPPPDRSLDESNLYLTLRTLRI